MSPDDLIAAFKELTDPYMRIDRAVVGDVETIRLAGWTDLRAKHKFDALASDAVKLFDPEGQGYATDRWLRIVCETVPDLVDANVGNPKRDLGYVIANGDRMRYISETIPNAASASVMAVRRLRDQIRRRPSRVPEAAIEAACRRCPTLLAALIYLARRSDVRATTDAERAGKHERHDSIAGEPIAFALEWIGDQLALSSDVHSALFDYVGRLARRADIDPSLSRPALQQLERLETPEHRRAFWLEMLSRFPYVGTDLLEASSATLQKDPSASSRSPKRASGHWRKPEQPTRPATLKEIAEWLGVKQGRTVRNQANRGEIMLGRFRGKFIACLTDVQRAGHLTADEMHDIYPAD